MSNAPLMPMATAVWLVENTTLTFKQIANFCNLHEVEIQGIGDGEVAKGIKAYNPIISGKLSKEEIELSSKDENMSGIKVCIFPFKPLFRFILLVFESTSSKIGWETFIGSFEKIEEAQKLFDSLSSLLPDEQISFFPQDEFLTTEMLAMSSDFKIERINTIKKIINNQKSIKDQSSKR